MTLQTWIASIPTSIEVALIAASSLLGGVVLTNLFNRSLKAMELKSVRELKELELANVREVEALKARHKFRESQIDKIVDLRNLTKQLVSKVHTGFGTSVTKLEVADCYRAHAEFINPALERFVYLGQEGEELSMRFDEHLKQMGRSMIGHESNQSYLKPSAPAEFGPPSAPRL